MDDRSRVFMIALALYAACSASPEEFQFGHAAIPDQNAPTTENQEPITNNEEYSSLGNVQGLGEFPAVARIRLAETHEGMPGASLLVSGTFPVGKSVDLAVDMTLEQSRDLAGGMHVDFEGTSGVALGRPLKEVVHVIRSVDLSVADTGVVTLHFTLGDEMSRSAEAPAFLGGYTDMTITGDLWIDCQVPGSEGRREFATDDPHLETEYCQQMVSLFGLEGLADLR